METEVVIDPNMEEKILAAIREMLVKRKDENVEIVLRSLQP